MKRILFLLSLLVLVFHSLAAQTSLGMTYQAVARDETGQILSNKTLSLKFSFSTKEKENQSYYSEVHQVTTDELGLINLVIGEGKNNIGELADIPWATYQVWLDVEMDATGGNKFALLGSTELQTVPYAFYAATASQLVSESTEIELPVEKSQSIYWTTSGNTLTRPETHFVGTKDAQNLVLKTNNTTRVVLTSGGQMQIKSGVDGKDDDIAAYPLTIEGSQQGIYITIKGLRSTANDFMTFADDENTWGQIEGRTLDELKDSWEYKSQIATFTLNAISLAAGAIAAGIETAGLFTAAGLSAATIIFIWQVPGWALAAAGATVITITTAAEAISLGIEIDNWITNTVNGVGVTYNSGAGDYAEWLRRSNKVRDLQYGEIVGVTGGVVSLNTNDAQHIMVVSKQPIVLGNAPQPNAKHLFEKIAFMGQVPVKVAGKVEIGDYILPSGNFDGLGIAVNPKDMKISDFSKIVGVSWEIVNDESMLHYVNVAVGLKNNALAPKVDEISNKVDNIIAYLEGRGALRPEGITNNLTTNGSNLAPGSTTATKQFTDAEFDKMVDLNEPLFKQIYAKAKTQLIAQGYDLSAHPELNEFLDNPVPMMKKLRRDPDLLTQWSMVDKKIQKELKK
ncbi:hypothetical protein [Haliscomenobacter sp.]|uniref:hypothetical protein n=1 Tax=Haliscomenobacter sp. TaxID=2717303 RepID=UPI0033651923